MFFMDVSLVEASPQVNKAPIFRHLDISRPIYTVPTSYTEFTEEVMTYTSRLNRGEPTAIYEFVQNQYDYNEDTSGPPLIYVTTSSGDLITYPQLIQMDKKKFQQVKDNCQKIEFKNHIKEGEFLHPESVVHTRHGGSTGTLGQHGRGGKAASAALVASGNASNIEYLSRDENGSWHGEASLLIDKEHFPHQITPSYTLGYQYFEPAEPLKETVLTVHDPSEIVVETLRKLPDYFLVANPKYAHYRMNEVSKDVQEASLFTTWSWLPENTTENNTSFSAAEHQLLRLNSDVTYRELPRVEILPDTVVSKHGYQENLTDRVFVDGLSMETFKHYALNWSFWGCGNGQDGYRAQRSTDSDYIRGEFHTLMARVLSKCTNPTVFETLFERSFGDAECAEGKNLPEDEFVNEIARNPLAKAAMTEAWKQFCQKNQLGEQVLVTASAESLKKAERKGIQAARINSSVFVKALHKLDIVKELDQTIDLPKDPTSTGEKSKIYRSNDFEERKVAMYRALKDLSKEKGTIQFTPAGEIIITVTRMPTIVDYPFISLPSDIEWLCRRHQDYFGKKSLVRLVVDPGQGKATQITQVASEDYWEKKFLTIENFKQEIDSSGQRGTTLVLGHSDSLRDGQYNTFYEDFQTMFKSLTSDGQTIDPEKLTTVLSPDDLFEDALHSKSRQLAEMKSEIARQKFEAEQELLAVKAQLKEAKRQLGIIEEDEGVLGPTRIGVHPDAEIDWAPPKGFKRQYMTLFRSNSALVTSNGGRHLRRPEDMPSPRPHREPKIESQSDVQAYLQEKLDLLVQPDIKMLHADLLPAQIQDTLVCSQNIDLSGEINYKPIELECVRSATKPGVLMNKSIVAGTTAIPCPPNCRVVGFYHPEKDVAKQIKINYSSERGFYNFESQAEIKPGLEFYFEYDSDLKITGQPTPKEREPLADRKFLTPRWLELVQTVERHKPPLTEKQKLDIALTAWRHAFRYDKDPRIDLQYRDLSREERAAMIVNNARGNCGYCSEGFAILCRLVGIPSTDLSGYLGKNGRFFPGPQNHGMTGAFINNEWVTVEPQYTYLSAGYTREEIPAAFAKIIEQIPLGENIYPLIEQSEQKIGVEQMVAKLKELGIVLDNKSLDMLQQILSIQETDDQNTRFYDPNEPSIPGITPKTTPPSIAATKLRKLIVQHHQANEQGLVTLDEQPPFEFDVGQTPEFKLGVHVIEEAHQVGMAIDPATSNPQEFLHSLAEQQATTTIHNTPEYGLGSALREQAAASSIPIAPGVNPEDIINFLSMQRARSTPQFILGENMLRQALDAGMRITEGTTPVQVAEFLAREQTLSGKLVNRLTNRLLAKAEKQGMMITSDSGPEEALNYLIPSNLRSFAEWTHRNRRILFPATLAALGLEVTVLMDMTLQQAQVAIGIPPTGLIGPLAETVVNRSIDLVSQINLSHPDENTLKTISNLLLVGGGGGTLALLVNRINQTKIMKKLRSNYLHHKLIKKYAQNSRYR